MIFQLSPHVSIDPMVAMCAYASDEMISDPDMIHRICAVEHAEDLRAARDRDTSTGSRGYVSDERGK